LFSLRIGCGQITRFNLETKYLDARNVTALSALRLLANSMVAKMKELAGIQAATGSDIFGRVTNTRQSPKGGFGGRL